MMRPNGEINGRKSFIQAWAQGKEKHGIHPQEANVSRRNPPEMPFVMLLMYLMDTPFHDEFSNAE